MASEIVTHIFSESRKGIKLVLLWEDRKVISSSNISMFQLLFRGSEGSSVVLLVMVSGGFCSSGHRQNSCAKINRCPVVLLDTLIHLGCQLVVWKSHKDSPKSSYTGHNIGRKDTFAACSGSFGLLQPLGWAGTTCTLGSVPQLVLIQLPKYFQPQKHILFLDRSNYSSICWTKICFAWSSHAFVWIPADSPSLIGQPGQHRERLTPSSWIKEASSSFGFSSCNWFSDSSPPCFSRLFHLWTSPLKCVTQNQKERCNVLQSGRVRWFVEHRAPWLCQLCQNHLGSSWVYSTSTLTNHTSVFPTLYLSCWFLTLSARFIFIPVKF